MTRKTLDSVREDFITAAVDQLDTALGHANTASERMMTVQQGNLAFATDLTRLGLAFGEQTARRLQALGRSQIDQANASFRAMASAPSPADLLAIQLELVRTVSNGFAAEMTQASEAAMRHSGAVLETMSRHLGQMVDGSASGASD